MMDWLIGNAILLSGLGVTLITWLALSMFVWQAPAAIAGVLAGLAYLAWIVRRLNRLHVV